VKSNGKYAESNEQMKTFAPESLVKEQRNSIEYYLEDLMGVRLLL
jgi:hypothetical protein